MVSSNLVRWGGLAAMLGGVTWVVLGLGAVVGYLQAIPGREDIVLFVVALLLTATGLVGLHTLQKGSYGLLGLAGFYIALAAITARILGAVVFLAGSSALEWISLPGTLGMLVGFVLYGVLYTINKHAPPRFTLRRAKAVGYPHLGVAIFVVAHNDSLSEELYELVSLFKRLVGVLLDLRRAFTKRHKPCLSALGRHPVLLSLGEVRLDRGD